MRILNRYWIILLIVCSVVVGILNVGPQFFIRSHINSSELKFLSPNMENASDVTEAYLPRAREVYDGHFPPSELSFDYGGPFLLPPIPPLIFSFFIKLFNGNIQLSYLLLIFIFTSIIFLFFYWLFWQMSKNKAWSLLFSFVGILTPVTLLNNQFFFNLNSFLNISVKNFYPFVNTPLDNLFFSRIDDPLLTYPFYIVSIGLLFIFWKTPKLWSAMISGIFVGFMSYVYFHYWVFLVVVSVFLFTLSILNFRQDFIRLKMFIVFSLSALIVMIPYFINYFRLINLNSYADYISRTWVERGRYLRLSIWREYVSYAISALLVYFYVYKKNKNEAFFYFSLICAMFIVWNIQIITGYIPHPYHFWKAVSPVMFLIMFGILYNVFGRFYNKKFCILVLILCILLISKKVVNISIFSSNKSDLFNNYTLSNSIVDSWGWINFVSNKEPVIISNSYITSYYLYSYTSARPFLPTALNSFVSNEILENRFLLSNKLFGVSSELVEKKIRRDGIKSSENSQQIYGNYFASSVFDIEAADNNDSKLKHWYVPEEKVNDLIDKFNSLNEKFNDITADYVYVGPFEKESGAIDFYVNSDLKLVFQNEKVKIYSILK